MRRTLPLKGATEKLPVFLAPMAGYTDRSFRRIAFLCGLSYAVTEMVSVKALSYGDERTARIANAESATGVQLFGHDPEIFARVIAERLEPSGQIEWYDLNFGCPAPKIVKNGDGSRLLESPETMAAIIRACKRTTSKPVSAKMRLGYRGTEDPVEIARRLEEAGVDFLTVHGRTRDMFYSGRSDFAAIVRIREAVSIPVVANGDIDTPETAVEILREGQVDGIAVGRAAVGNPLFFSELCAMMGKPVETPSLGDLAKRQFEELLSEKGERVAVNDFKKHFMKYIRGEVSVAKLRAKIGGLHTACETLDMLAACFDKHSANVYNEQNNDHNH